MWQVVNLPTSALSADLLEEMDAVCRDRLTAAMTFEKVLRNQLATFDELDRCGSCLYGEAPPVPYQGEAAASLRICEAHREALQAAKRESGEQRGDVFDVRPLSCRRFRASGMAVILRSAVMPSNASPVVIEVASPLYKWRGYLPSQILAKAPRWPESRLHCPRRAGSGDREDSTTLKARSTLAGGDAETQPSPSDHPRFAKL